MIVRPGGLAWPKRLLGKQKIAGPNPARGSTQTYLPQALIRLRLESIIILKGVVFDLDATLVDLGEHVRWREAQGEIIEAYRPAGAARTTSQLQLSKGLFNLMHEMDTLSRLSLGAN